MAAGEVWVVFQPHTTNRTAALLDEFAGAFGDAQHALILPIYRPSGREVAAAAGHLGDLVERVRALGIPTRAMVESFDGGCRRSPRRARAGDLVLTMGAGDVTRLSDLLVEALEA